MYITWHRFLFQANYAGFVLFIGMISFVTTNRTFPKKLSRLFIVDTVLTFLLMISDNIRNYTVTLTEPGFLRYFSAACGYTLRPFILYFMALLSGRYCKKDLRLFVIPTVINGLLAILSCTKYANGLMFYFDSSNVFHSGKLWYSPYAVSLLYIVIILYFSFKVSRVNPFESIIIVVFVLFCAFATALEKFKKYDLILAQTLSLSILFYYLFLNIQFYKRDSLTQLLTRRCFYLDAAKFSKKSFIILSMDMNGLKFFNDTYGHKAGDEALISVVSVMNKTFKRKAILYRTGGDEFMAIFKKASLKKVEKAVQDFQKNLKKINKEVACGIAIVKPGDSIESMVALADSNMYQNKKELKSK